MPDSLQIADDQVTILSLSDFLSSVPPPFTTALVRLRPWFFAASKLVQILSWRSSWYESWLLLCAWWIVCLFGEFVIRYALPVAVLSSLYAFHRLRFLLSQQSTLASEQTLESTLTHLITLQNLLPTIAISNTPNFLPLSSLLRLCAILSLTTSILIHFAVSPRVIVAVVGSLFLTWKAPWAVLIRTRLWRSAWIRWTWYHLWSRLSGTSLPHGDLRSANPTRQASISSDNKEIGAQLRFLFTLYENQRWWMGLDFTAALLPNERPPWCSGTHHQVQPPTSFSLPEPSHIVQEITTDKVKRKVRRQARWRWEDPEWRVLVRTEGSTSMSRVERPLPPKDDGTRTALLSRAASKMQKERETHQPSSSKDPELSEATAEGGKGSGGQENDEPPEEDTITDADGWVYGDNKWEHSTGKGGMGKYTRYRRWTRVAVVEEFTEPLPDDFEIAASPEVTEMTSARRLSQASVETTSSSGGSPTRTRDALRQRLKALNNPS